MFNKKESKLSKTGKERSSKASGTPVTSTKTNAFVQAGLKNSARTLTGNGAATYSTTGMPFVDQFGKLGQYLKPRSFDAVAKDMATLWAIDPLMTVKLTAYIRLVTRQALLLDGEKTEQVQRGGGLKNEGIMRMLWLAIYHPDTFAANIGVWISIGSWKDIFEMLRMDLANGERKLNWNGMAAFIQAGLLNENFSELVKKYLPTAYSPKQQTSQQRIANTMIAKYLANFMGLSMKEYRLLKASGTAHSWQQLISQRMYHLLDFNKIHGRALAQLVGSKFLANHGLEKVYEAWIEKQSVAKFKGFPFELTAKITPALTKKYLDDTINAQFMGLVETAKKGATTSTRWLAVRDTSGSMASKIDGANFTAGDVAKSMALFFSYMLPDGPFSDVWIEFTNSAKLNHWKGFTPVERWRNDRSSYLGGTNFQAVIDLLVDLRKRGLDETEFPTGIICFSDYMFDPADVSATNVEVAREKLRRHFSREFADNFGIALWNITSTFYDNKGRVTFDSYGNQSNVYYFSGYDASIVAFLTGLESKAGKAAPQNAEELFLAAMDQEILDQLSLN